MEDKAKSDRVAGGLWRIHGRAYDFSSFAAKHPGDYVPLNPAFAALCTLAFVAQLAVVPGGKHWVELTRGLDITDLFEVHHLNIDKATAILPKYYIQASDALDRYRRRNVFLRTVCADALQEDVATSSCYTWAPGDFYSTLRSRLKNSIPQHGPTAQFLAICYLTLALWSMLWFMAVSHGSFAFALAAGLMMHALMGIGCAGAA